MTPESVMTIGQHALEVTLLLSGPLLLSALVAGVVIGMLQAATQINEATLSFIPKLLVLTAVLFVAGPWMLGVLVDYTRDLYTSIPELVQE
ncbi:MAG: flagellar biosynthesis protein FliQ [Steroidobacteraceae bacterium]